ncbi:hypothetical protein APC71_15845 [Acinetobacter baumannii]|nr:hypothetical protein APC71_15845 [Acinetobacter baumannii]
MPYIIELDFEGNKLVGKHEHCHIEKEFKGDQRQFLLLIKNRRKKRILLYPLWMMRYLILQMIHI